MIIIKKNFNFEWMKNYITSCPFYSGTKKGEAYRFIHKWTRFIAFQRFWRQGQKVISYELYVVKILDGENFITNN